MAWLWWHERCMPHVRVAVKVVARCTPPRRVALNGVYLVVISFFFLTPKAGWAGQGARDSKTFKQLNTCILHCGLPYL